jgi:hypothetical protein
LLNAAKIFRCNRIATTALLWIYYDLNGDRVTQFRGGLGIFTLDYL